MYFFGREPSGWVASDSVYELMLDYVRSDFMPIRLAIHHVTGADPVLGKPRLEYEN
jgi:hypothetical protein